MCKGKGGCSSLKVAKWLLIIGGINWGLVGLGLLLGNSLDSWNLVHMIFGRMAGLEGIIYVLVGIAAIMKIFGCKCHKCKDGTCTEGMMKDGIKEEKKEGAAM